MEEGVCSQQTENMELKNQLDSLRQTSEQLRVKLEEDRRASAEMDDAILSQRTRNENLKRENRHLKALNESINEDIKEKEKQRSEMSCLLSGRQVAHLINAERAKLIKQNRALEDQREEYRLALDSCCQDLDKRWMNIEGLEGLIEELLTIIKGLKAKKKDLEDQLAEVMAFGEPNVDESEAEEQGQLPHSYVELSDVEEEVIAEDVHEEKEQENTFGVEVHTKSWWHRQGERLWKAFKRMGTFCLDAMHCRGLRSCLRQAFRSNRVHPVCLPV